MGGDGVAIGVEGHTEAIGGTHGVQGAQVVEVLGHGMQESFFLLEQLDGGLACFPVDALIGDGVEPVAGSRVEGVKVGDVESCK